MKTFPKTCPCKNCDKRKVGCHSNCENETLTYEEWKNSGVEEPKRVWYQNNAYNKKLKQMRTWREQGRSMK